MKSSEWLNISPKDFEELIFWILQREGFLNVSWYGESGADKGRDITCQRTELLGPRVVIYNCVVQCKRYSGRVARQKIFEDILKVSEYNPDYFILATTGIVNASTKDWLNSHAGRIGMKVVLWERTDLQILLDRHQDLGAKFFGVSIESNYLIKNLSIITTSSSFDKFLLTPVVRTVFTYACKSSLDYSKLLTVGHLLIPLLKKDRKCTRVVFLEKGFEPDKVADILEETFVNLQPEFPTIQFGLLPSTSFRLIIETAIKLMKTLNEGFLSERVLLLSILVQPHSGTINFLKNRCYININDLISLLLEKFFNKNEISFLSERQPIFITPSSSPFGPENVKNSGIWVSK